MTPSQRGEAAILGAVLMVGGVGLGFVVGLVGFLPRWSSTAVSLMLFVPGILVWAWVGWDIWRDQKALRG